MSDSAWDAMILVGRVARTHGLKGDVLVNPETDFVELRFAPGSRLFTRGGSGAGAATRELVVEASRLAGARPVVRFEGVERIEEAEGLAGCELRIPEGEVAPLEDGMVYEHQLVGCAVERLVDGVPVAVGRVARVEGGAGGSRLVVMPPTEPGRSGESGEIGGEIQIPFATAICVEVDVVNRRIRIDPPEGLLDVNAPGPPRERKRFGGRKHR